MLINFEDITEELSDEDLFLVQVIIRGLSKRNKHNPLKSDEVVKIINNNKDKYKLKTKFTNVRLRKCCNYIRKNGLLPLIATSKGYYVSMDKNEISKQIESLEQRASAILRSANGLKEFLNANLSE
jgi:predicted ATP-dependent protease